MEIYSNSTRFALACNTSSKIIEPIQSRCALVRLARLSDQEILGRLMAVVAAEKVLAILILGTHAISSSAPLAASKWFLLTLVFNQQFLSVHTMRQIPCY